MSGVARDRDTYFDIVRRSDAHGEVCPVRIRVPVDQGHLEGKYAVDATLGIDQGKVSNGVNCEPPRRSMACIWLGDNSPSRVVYAGQGRARSISEDFVQDRAAQVRVIIVELVDSCLEL